MPIYEYRCEACGEVIEALQRMSDPPLTDCTSPRHGGSASPGTLHKLLSAHVVGGSAPQRASSPAPGCGRCGDPQGPCGLPN